jgi:hypothetical protein
LICKTHHDLLVKNGVKFAGIDAAKYFSHELLTPEIVGIKPFGFHQYKDQNRRYPQFPSMIKQLGKRIARLPFKLVKGSFWKSRISR